MTENATTETTVADDFEYEAPEGVATEEQIEAGLAAAGIKRSDYDAMNRVGKDRVIQMGASTEADAEAEAEVATPAKPEKAEGVRDLKAFERDTWQGKIVESAVLTDRAEKATKKASALLWNGSQQAINEWLTDSDRDVHAEYLYADLLDLLGTKRKGDASKIRTVGLAVKSEGLVLDAYANLSQAYTAAVALTKTAKVEKAEDDAAEAVVEEIASAAPSSTTTAEGAAQILLSKGVDGAVVAILDALNGATGEHNEAAHRSFFRAVGAEIQARNAAAKAAAAPAKAEPAAPKDGATPAKAKATPAKAAPVKATPKAAPVKATPAKTTAEKVASTANTDKTKRALPVKR